MEGVKSVKLVYTRQEWEMLERYAQQSGKKNFNAWFNVEMYKLAERAERFQTSDCITCDEEKKVWLYKIPPQLIPQIEKMARLHCEHVSHVAARFITDPALANLFEERF